MSRINGLNYARRQQYRRLSRAAAAAMASGAALLSALVVAGVGAVSAAGVMLALAIGFGFYARHWLSLAERSRVGARSEDEVRRILAALQAEGWRLRHSLPWRGQGDIDSLSGAAPVVGLVRQRGIERVEQAVLVVSIDRLIPVLRSAVSELCMPGPLDR